MTDKWKIIVPVGLVVVAVIAVAVYFQVAKTPQIGEQQIVSAPSVPSVSVPPAATANIDDMVDALLQEAAADQLVFNDIESDLLLFNADSQAISDFGQSFNESEF